MNEAILPFKDLDLAVGQAEQVAVGREVSFNHTLYKSFPNILWTFKGHRAGNQKAYFERKGIKGFCFKPSPSPFAAPHPQQLLSNFYILSPF